MLNYTDNLNKNSTMYGKKHGTIVVYTKNQRNGNTSVNAEKA